MIISWRSGGGGSASPPAETDVRALVTYSANGIDYTGTLDLPAESDVVEGVIFDNGTKTGTATTITLDQVGRAVWDALLVDHTTSGSFGAFVKKLLTLGKFIGLK